MNFNSHIKTFLFFALIVIAAIIPGQMNKNKSLSRSLKAFFLQSENAREIYTGKVREVYDPLDQAYIITPKLKKMIQVPLKHDFKLWPVLSIWVDPDDLYSDERGIIKNGYKTGRLWERASFVKYFENNEKLFESYAGIRQHGGTSRNPNFDIKSFRLYFRGKYGEKSFLTNLGLTQKESVKIKRLIVRKDLKYNFGNDFAFYLIKSLGGDAPNSKHVAFFLNGKLYGFHTITEHLSFDQIKHSYGHEDFVFAKIKGKKSLKDRLLYIDLRDRLEQQSNLDFDLVDSWVDLDSMMSSLLTIMYTGNTDWSQGVYVKDLKSKTSKWKVLSWDFDRVAVITRESKRGNNLEAHSIKSVSLGMEMKKGKIRWSIFNRLIHNDKKFRDYFSKLVDKLFVITNGSGFTQRLSGYEALAIDSKDAHVKASIKLLKSFVSKRWPVLCQDLKAQVKLIPKSCKNI